MGVAAAAVLVAAGLGACGTSDYEVRRYGPTAAAGRGDAEAYVEFVNHNDGTYSYELEAEDLPQPSEVEAGATSYVVWLQRAEAAPPLRLGTLELDGDEGELEGTTPFCEFQLFVTAERNETPPTPDGPLVVKAAVNGCDD